MSRRIYMAAGLSALLVGLVAGGLGLTVWMPGSSFEDRPPPMDDEQRRSAERLETDVRTLADEIGPRHVGAPEGLARSVEFLEDRLREAGHRPRRQTFEVRGVDCHNLEVEIPGGKAGDEIVVVGAHYDSYLDTPAANDNASGVAALLELARTFADVEPERTLRLVLFVNEEPPFFTTSEMGSYRYARRSHRRGEDIVAMASLETIGYYTDEPGSQDYPIGLLSWMYGDRGDFVGFVGNLGSRSTLREAVEAFRTTAEVPSEGASLPGFVPGVGWSDHWSFWQFDYPGIMVTDTALYRYPYYHTDRDTPEKLDYETMVRVVEGLEAVVDQWAGVNR